MKVPVLWRVCGYFLEALSLIALFGFTYLVIGIGLDYTIAVMGVFFWLALLSIGFSFVVGVLLIRGSIWGYHLTKVLLALSIMDLFLLMFDQSSSQFLSIIIRIIVICQLLYSKKTKLYLSDLRNTLKKNV